MNQKIDKTVLRETLYIAAAVLVMSLIMELVFVCLSKWDYTVLLGNLLGGAVAVLNFFLMGMMVQSALGKDDKGIQNTVRASQMLRMVMLFASAAVGVLAPCFNVFATLIPLFFPRIAIIFRPMFKSLDSNDDK